MNTSVSQHVIRFVTLVLIQVLIFKGISLNFGFLSKTTFLIYPLFIMLLPINIQRSILLVIAFFLGLSVDIFYDSVGVHAAASVLTAYSRDIVLKLTQPVQGYKTAGSPSAHNFGFNWFLLYSSVMLVIHSFAYFSIDAFSFVYIGDILLKTLLCFIFSMIFIMIHQIIFKVN